MKTHMEQKHPNEVENSASNCDFIYNHTKQLLKMLLLKRSLDQAIKYGDGDSLFLTIKFMFLYFKAGNNPKYALACFELIIANQVLLSERMKTAVLFNRFVNNLGHLDSNIPIDQELEFANRDFKDGFTLSQGEPTNAILLRLSKSQDSVKTVLQTFKESFDVNIRHSRRKMNMERYTEDVFLLVESLREAKLFTKQPGRKFLCASLNHAGIDPLTKLNLFKLKDWMLTRVTDLLHQPQYYYV